MIFIYCDSYNYEGLAQPIKIRKWDKIHGIFSQKVGHPLNLMQKNRLNTRNQNNLEVPKNGTWPSKSGKVNRYDTAYFNVTDCVGNAVLNEPISALCTGIKPSSLIYYIFL